MTPGDFDFLCRFLKTRSGLALGADKQYLIESRLGEVVRRAGLGSLGELVAALRGGRDPALAEAVVSAMTTNETYFFRDKAPFDRFRDTIVPALLQARAREKRLRLWCAAASTGQEPYSLAMILAGFREQLAGWRLEILATDIDAGVLDRARAGTFTQFEVQRGLPIRLLLEHFDKVGESWRIRDDLRGMIDFRRFNLLESFAAFGRFDVVFCRNVLIYFDAPTKADVLERLARVIADDGFLVLGAAETMVGLTDAFRPRPEAGLYAPNRVAAHAALAQRRPVVAA